MNRWMDLSTSASFNCSVIYIRILANMITHDDDDEYDDDIESDDEYDNSMMMMMMMMMEQKFL